MKIFSNEVKIGLLAAIALSLAFWGYKFIQGRNLLKRSNIYYVEYDNVSLLKLSTPVTINGVQVGFVSEIQPVMSKDNVLVTLSLEKDVRIPKNTLAELREEGFMGGKSVALRYQAACSGEDCAQSGDYIQGRVFGMLGSMVSPDELNTYLSIVQSGLKNILDSLNQQLLSKDAQGPLAESLRNLQGTLANLNHSTAQLDALMASSSGDIAGSLRNMRSISQNIAASNARISSLIANAEKFSGQLDKVNLEKTMAELDATLGGLKKTVQSADQTFSGINTIMADVNEGKGSLGKLLHDEKLYEDLSGLGQRTDSLITDIQERPYRYIPLKSRAKVKRFDRQDAQSSTVKPDAGN
ncbi:MAG: hypothetical protein RL181_132 [Bacteroidota bacterium]